MQDASGFGDPGSRLRKFGLEVAELADEDGANVYLLTGNTFAHRGAIRAGGGRWRAAQGGWLLSGRQALDALADALENGGLAEAPAAGFAEAGAHGKRKHYHGHRERLRTRFRENPPTALADYELLELILFFSVYRRDTKPIAKDMIARFGGLGGVLAADPERYRECFGLDPQRVAADDDRRLVREDDLHFTQVLLKAVHELLQRVLREDLCERPLIGSWSGLLEYLAVAMQHEPAEHFRILFLDRKNMLIKDEVQSRGTVDHTPLYPREVVKRALELGASAVIMVHNHPSGDPTPSQADIEMTRRVVQGLSAVGITVHDHVIVGRGKHASFRALGLL